jgi:hypothetical protein
MQVIIIVHIGICLQKPEDEILLRKVLFDDVLLVDYPFLYQNANYIKSLALTRLIITHDAVEYFRYDKIVYCALLNFRSIIFDMLMV